MAHQRSMSDGYTHEDLGVTRAEFDRLLRAIDNGAIPAAVAFDKRNISLFKHNGIRVDDLIRNWSGANYKDPFADRDIVITQREFEDIVYEAASKAQGLKECEVDGMAVYATFYSGSRQHTWEAKYCFDDNWRMVECRATYPEAKVLRWFADDIERLIRRLIDERDYR